MAKKNYEDRLAALEAEVARLKASLNDSGGMKKRWWEQIAGTFEGDPLYAEAMHLGREYRESLRPKTRRKKR